MFTLFVILRISFSYQIDALEPEGLGVDDVEAAAPIHQDLGEPDVADDGVDDERVFPWARHVVGVVSKVVPKGMQSLQRKVSTDM